MKGKSKFSFSKLFYNDKFVMLFSVIVAFCIWVALPGNSEETTYAYIKDIPISAPELGSDLKVFYMNKTTASVRVSGNSLILRNLTKDDIDVSLGDEFAEIDSTAEKSVKLSAKKGSLANDYSIIANSLDPERVMVFVDREDEADIDITAEVKASVDESHHIDSFTPSKKSVHVKGAQSIIQKIHSAKAVYEFSDSLTESQTIEAQIKFYDEDDKEIDSLYFDRKYIEADFTVVNVKVTVLKLKELNIEPSIINAPDSFDSENSILTVEPQTIQIAVPNDETTDITSVTTKDIDLSKVSPDNAEFDVELVVPSGVRIVNDITSAKVTFDSEKLNSKNFTVTNIQLRNKPDGKKVTLNTKSVSVTLVGDAQQLSKIKASDMTAVIDMNSSALSGSTTMNASITIDSPYDFCWPYSIVTDNPYPVIVTVSDSENSSVSSSESS